MSDFIEKEFMKEMELLGISYEEAQSLYKKVTEEERYQSLSTWGKLKSRMVRTKSTYKHIYSLLEWYSNRIILVMIPLMLVSVVRGGSRLLSIVIIFSSLLVVSFLLLSLLILLGCMCVDVISFIQLGDR